MPAAPTAWAATSSASLAPAGPLDAALIMDAADALTERGGSFDIGCSYGLVRLDAGGDSVDALQTADRRLYENKRSRRAGTAESVHRVLMGVVGEHDGELHHHVVGVAAPGRARSAARWGWAPPTSSTSAVPPRCTTSARSRSPTTSCTRRAR